MASGRELVFSPGWFDTAIRLGSIAGTFPPALIAKIAFKETFNVLNLERDCYPF